MSSFLGLESTSPPVAIPSLPVFYFGEIESPLSPRSNNFVNAGQKELSLQNLPPELLHRCLVQYSCWGDLSKLACVQKNWSFIVKDAADFGGRDAVWELSMCLLQGSDFDGGSQKTGNEVEFTRIKGNQYRNKGLAKNEALGVKYLTELSGVEMDDDKLETETGSTPTNQSNSVLPNDWIFPMKCNADEAALLALANCHLHGIGLKPNPKLALHCLQSAFHLTKSAESAHTLALIYEYSRKSNNLVPIDVCAAYEWFKAAAELGHIPSMAELALCYELGCGTTQNDTAALDWYMKAANSGHGASHYSVGEHYEEARGVPQDEEEACLWYHRAAVMGEQDGVSGLKRLRHVARRVLSVNNLQELAGHHDLNGILHE